jgi:CHAD domain-containing protein
MASVTASASRNAAQKSNRRFAPKTGDSATLTHSVVHPIAQLHERITRLDAAMVVCRALPKKEPVHTLRKATRYVEAQLALLELIPNLPAHTAEADKVRKRLRSVRRAAGSVRDFDVQRGLVKDDEPAKNAKAKRPSGKNSNASNSARKKGTKSSAAAELRSEAQALAKYLKQQRNQDADKLTDLLDGEEQRLAKALRKLETALEPAEERTVPADRLATEIQRWFHGHTPHLTASHDGTDPVQSLDEAALHTLRKISKLCRYMAESLPEEFPTAQQLTSRYEEIQESGGKWHDWLLLRDIAASRQGKRAVLSQRYAEHRDQALAHYRSHLADLLPTNGAQTAEQPGEHRRARASHRRGLGKGQGGSPQPLEIVSSARQ